MSGRVSDRVLRLINRAQYDEALFLLLVLNHPTWASPLRLVNSQIDRTVSGVLYKACGFSVPMPPQTKVDLPEVSLSVDNTDRVVSQKLLEMTDRRPGSASLSVVFSGDLDTIEAGPMVTEWNSPTITGKLVSFTLTTNADLNEGYPMHKYRPATHPGLFANAV